MYIIRSRFCTLVCIWCEHKEDGQSVPKREMLREEWVSDIIRRTWDDASKSGDQQDYKKAHQLKFKNPKVQKQCIEKQFDKKNTRNMWQKIKRLNCHKDTKILIHSMDSNLLYTHCNLWIPLALN